MSKNIISLSAGNQAFTSENDAMIYARLSQGDPQRNLEAYDPNILRTNAGLPEAEWDTIDRTVTGIIDKRLTFTNTLKKFGMIDTKYTIGDLLVKWYRMFDLNEDIKIDMMGDGQTNNERISYDMKAVPLPIFYKDFRIPWRFMESNKGNRVFDVPGNMLTRYARKIAEGIELMNLNGNSNIVLNGYGIDGATTHSNIKTGSMSTHWDDDPTKVYPDVLKMREALVSVGFPEDGPYVLFIPSAYNPAMQTDYKAYSDKTVKQRVLDIDGIKDVVTVSDLAATKVMLMYMTPETMEIAQAMETQTLEWQSNGPFVNNFRLMAAQVPKIYTDTNDQLGIVVYTES